MRASTWMALILLAILARPSRPALGETPCCARCGASACCRPVCRCVPATEEKKKLCFECRCEDFCVPGPSIWCGRKCEPAPLPADSCGCDQHCCISWNLWKPCGAHVRTRKVLVVHEVKKEVPSHEWVVEYLCDDCRRGCPDAAAHAAETATNAQLTADVVHVSLDAAAPEVAPPPRPAKKGFLARLLQP